jgi:hypothetical protein
MYNPDTDLLFPLRVIPQLKTMRGEEWSKVIERFQAGDFTRVEKYAFVLMMVRMGGCISCNADSFRAMRGCTSCARQTVKRYRGSDLDLLEQFRLVQKEVEAYQKKQTPQTTE